MSTPKIGMKCPRCAAPRILNWRFNHNTDCTIGKAERRTRTADQVWFDRGSRRVERPSTWDEIALVEAAGLELPADPMTVVRQFGRVERTIGGHGPEW